MRSEEAKKILNLHEWICIKGLELTDIGESAPRLLSRKNEAESIDATVNMTGFDWSEEETFIGGSDDQTLPFIFKIQKNQRLK